MIRLAVPTDTPIATLYNILQQKSIGQITFNTPFILYRTIFIYSMGKRKSFIQKWLKFVHKTCLLLYLVSIFREILQSCNPKAVETFLSKFYAAFGFFSSKSKPLRQ